MSADLMLSDTSFQIVPGALLTPCPKYGVHVYLHSKNNEHANGEWVVCTTHCWIVLQIKDDWFEIADSAYRGGWSSYRSKFNVIWSPGDK